MLLVGQKRYTEKGKHFNIYQKRVIPVDHNDKNGVERKGLGKRQIHGQIVHVTKTHENFARKKQIPAAI